VDNDSRHRVSLTDKISAEDMSGCFLGTISRAAHRIQG